MAINNNDGIFFRCELRSAFISCLIIVMVAFCQLCYYRNDDDGDGGGDDDALENTFRRLPDQTCLHLQQTHT